MAIICSSPAFSGALERQLSGGKAECRRGFISCSSASPGPSGITKQIPKAWKSFSKYASGEWSGTGVEFDHSGKAIPIPSELVPEAYREWGVKLHDWDIYSATRVEKKRIPPSFYSKTLRLYPRSGCDATSVPIFRTEEREVKSPDDRGGFLGFHESGGFVALWRDEKMIEHCLVDESLSTVRTRARILQKLKGFESDEGGSVVERIGVFREQWEDDFQSGKTLESCLTLHAGLSTGYRLTQPDVRGVWQVFRSSFSPGEEGCGSINELVEEKPSSFMMEREHEIVSKYTLLPQNFWSVVKNVGDDELEIEAGWLITPALAAASRCRVTKTGEVRKVELESQVRTTEAEEPAASDSKPTTTG